MYAQWPLVIEALGYYYFCEVSRHWSRRALGWESIVSYQVIRKKPFKTGDKKALKLEEQLPPHKEIEIVMLNLMEGKGRRNILILL